MATATNTFYPMPSFHFSVSWGKDNVVFSEVSGLNMEVTPIEYRHGDSPDFSMMKMPGIKKFGNIVLKRGVVAGDNALFDWWAEIQMNQVKRKEVIISLLNEDHKPVVTWTVQNAFPAKVISGGLNAKNNEVLIETVELACEGLTIKNEEPCKK